jgi:hypothetical protein
MLAQQVLVLLARLESKDHLAQSERLDWKAQQEPRAQARQARQESLGLRDQQALKAM